MWPFRKKKDGVYVKHTFPGSYGGLYTVEYWNDGVAKRYTSVYLQYGKEEDAKYVNEQVRRADDAPFVKIA